MIYRSVAGNFIYTLGGMRIRADGMTFRVNTQVSLIDAYSTVFMLESNL